MDIIDHVAAALVPESVEKVVMYKIDRRGGGSKNRSIGQTQNHLHIYNIRNKWGKLDIV